MTRHYTIREHSLKEKNNRGREEEKDRVIKNTHSRTASKRCLNMSLEHHILLWTLVYSFSSLNAWMRATYHPLWETNKILFFNLSAMNHFAIWSSWLSNRRQCLSASKDYSLLCARKQTRKYHWHLLTTHLLLTIHFYIHAPFHQRLVTE